MPPLPCFILATTCSGIDAADELLHHDTLHTGESKHHDRPLPRAVRHAVRRHHARVALGTAFERKGGLGLYIFVVVVVILVVGCGVFIFTAVHEGRYPLFFCFFST